MMKQCAWQFGLVAIMMSLGGSAAASQPSVIPFQQVLAQAPWEHPLRSLNGTLQDSGSQVKQAENEATPQQAEADRLLEQGIQQYRISEFQAALQSWQQALALYQTIGDRRGEANALGNLGLAFHALGQYQQAIDLLQHQLAIVRDLGDRLGESNAIGNLGIAFQALGQYPCAIDLYQQQLTLVREVSFRAAFPTESRQGEANALTNLGNTYNALGQYRQAIEFHQQALVIRRDLGDRQGEAAALGNLSVSFRSLGQYQRAIDLLQQQLTLVRAIGDRWGEANALSNLGSTYHYLGQYQRAIDLFQQQLAIARQISNRQSEADALGNLGNTYNFFDQPQRAVDLLQQQLVITRDLGDRLGEANALGNLGIAYSSLGQYQNAIDVQQQALTIRRDIGDRRGEANSLGNLGLVYHALAQYDQAMVLHQQSLVIAREIDNRQDEAAALNNLGLALIKLNRLVEAEATLMQSIGAFESLRTDLPDANLITIADTQWSAYSLLEIALAVQGKTAEALEITERARARAFVLQLANRQSGSEPQIEWAAIDPPKPPTIAEIQQIARDQDATLVTYSLRPDQVLYIWVVQPSGDIEFRFVRFNGADDGANPMATLDGPLYRSDVSPSELDTLIAETRTGIAVVGDANPEALEDLHTVLIDPIADLLPTDPEANIVFIPQGRLFLVPFAALQDADGTYLVEKHTVLTAPSIQVLGLASQQGGEQTATFLQDRNALVVGNPVMPRVWIPGGDELQEIQLSPLPGTEAEALAIGDFLNVSPLIGDQATESRIKQQLPTAQLVHLATHGLLDYGDPQSSGILDVPGAVALTPGNGEDGLLTAAEILEMDLQAQLAILSACDTGRGRITGDGVVGLSRSLITAGVPSVIVSLWAVPDAPTAALMTEFYRQLQQGQTKAQALRQAMLTTMAQHPEPRNWAAFTLMGAAN
ncbi:MAG: CHAT domain-containing tetratricopeptide repeat protein [Cyanobacteria bacterium P01_A01_bin.123]